METANARLPDWLHKKAPDQEAIAQMRDLCDRLALNTICSSAMCPNQSDCFKEHIATFMIMGDVCTRNCRFCNVNKGHVLSLDKDEPHRVAMAASILRLSHVVITSVTRDDLLDGGASHFAATIREVRAENPDTTVEVLIPDLGGSLNALKSIVSAFPQVIGHNIETVPSLYSRVRPLAEYRKSLELLKNARIIDRRIITKSGLMLGLGESKREITRVMKDLRSVGCDILTLGQYLRPSTKHIPVVRYVTPEEFSELRKQALNLGFAAVASDPFVRSSFNSGELYHTALNSRIY
jgi:lipoic acid synthetase